METILRLVSLIYDSVADASRWAPFLESLLRAIRGRRASLLFRESRSGEFAAVCGYGCSDDDVRLYRERYAATDPWRSGNARWHEGKVCTDLDLCPRAELESSAAFREFYGPRDCVHGIAGTILVTCEGRSVIAAVRGVAEGPFAEPELAILRALMPHLKRAALLQGELGSLRAQVTTLTSHLDRYPHALVLADAERRVLYANAAARELPDVRDGLVMEAGYISLRAPGHDKAFREVVAAVARGHHASVRRMEVSRPSRKTSFRLMLMPVKASGMTPLGVSLPAVEILIVDSDAHSEPDPLVLRELFSLTTAEARVAAKLALGRKVGEIAAATNVSVETVRTHVKRILSKTGTDRQCELISLILRSVPFRT